MRKISMIVMLSIAAVVCFAQTNETLELAITNTTSYISSRLPNGARVLLFKLSAPTEALSSYVSEQLSSRLVNNGRFTVIERNPAILTDLRAETAYQMSGEVSDETAQRIGKQLGAQIVISGSISQVGTTYQLSIKIISIETVTILGQRLCLLQKEPFLEGLLVTPRLVIQPGVRPDWVSRPLEYGRAKYENLGTIGAATWYYDYGLSNMAASEQTANTRARQNIQANIAANIASEFKARLDVTESSLFRDSEYEDIQRLIETAITNSIKTRIPRYETLEIYTEPGRASDGKPWYISYILVRFPRQEIINVVEKIEPEQVLNEVIKEGTKAGIVDPVAAIDQEVWSYWIQELIEVRSYALEGFRGALTGN
ncbi:hypothetical protein FACS1894164_16270 [Spirochaetia bacterium]|nr:hypothetical protein FACS1894164_16270 [Spirochaetia bacterium]